MSSRIRDILFAQLTNRCSTSSEVEINHSEIADGNGLFLRASTQPVDEGKILFEEYPVGPTAIAFFRYQNRYCSSCVKRLSDTPCYVCPNEDCCSRYCSSVCMEIASQLHHKALCPSTNPAYREYLEFAKQSNNEYYIVSARLLWLFPNAPWRFHYT
jgi:hypothetical protein